MHHAEVEPGCKAAAAEEAAVRKRRIAGRCFFSGAEL